MPPTGRCKASGNEIVSTKQLASKQTNNRQSLSLVCLLANNYLALPLHYRAV